MSSPAQNRGGRPPEFDRHHVVAVALRLFEKKGFDAVTMGDVAKAAKASRRTLFRLFPSKADLVWEGLREVLRDVRPHLASLSPRRRSLATLGRDVFSAPLRQLDEPHAAELARKRLRLLAASPELLNHPVLDELRELAAELVAMNSKPGEVEPRLLANALISVGFAAMLWWATHDDGTTALQALTRALSGLWKLAPEKW